MIAKLYAPHSFLVNTTSGFIVGIDYGAYQLASKGIKMDLAIGDFDSVSDLQLEVIKKNSQNLIHLSIDKNETDSEAAILEVIKLGFSEIELYSDFGNRLDHLLNNIKLVAKYNIKYLSDYARVTSYQVGKYLINNEYPILSLLVLEDCRVSLKGTLYELDQVELNFTDNYTTSNSILLESAELEVHSGSIITIESLDK